MIFYEWVQTGIQSILVPRVSIGWGDNIRTCAPLHPPPDIAAGAGFDDLDDAGIAKAAQHFAVFKAATGLRET